MASKAQPQATTIASRRCQPLALTAAAEGQQPASVRVGKEADRALRIMAAELADRANELGVYHNLTRSLAIGSDSRPEWYRQGKAEREPADHRGSREP
jgi:hypothetical protein